MIGIVLLASKLLLVWRPERLEFLWRPLLRLKLLARDVSLFTRLKLLVNFYQICGALGKA